MTAQSTPDSSPHSRPVRRRWPILVLAVVAVVGAYWMRDVVTLDSLTRNQAALLAFRDAHYLTCAALFVLVYAAVVAFSLPGATVATLTGGFLFGLFPGVVLNVVAAGTGAVALFIAARAGIGAEVSRRMIARGGSEARLQAAIAAHEWEALFLMRLVPIVPFFVANLVPAFTGTRLSLYAVTTFLGIMPAAFVFTSLGQGLGGVLATGRVPEMADLVTPMVMAPLFGLAGLVALPLIIHLFRGRRP